MNTVPSTTALLSAMLGGLPMAYAERTDGSVSVVGPDGRKHLFTAEQMKAAADLHSAEEPRAEPRLAGTNAETGAKALPVSAPAKGKRK